MNTKLDPKKEKLTGETNLKELVLWDDQPGNLEFRISTLMNVCKISENESTNIVLDCLLDGCAKITTGRHDSLILMQEAFQKELIKTTIE